MPTETVRGWPIVALALLLALSSLFAFPPPPSSSQTTPACADVGAGPVVQDSGPAYTTFGSGNGTVHALYYTTTHDGPSVIIKNGQYVMWLRVNVNSSNGIYRAVSENGVDWNISASPALTPGPAGSWDHAQVLYPDVIWNGTGYLMYYMGDGDTNQTTYPANFRQIGVAFSSDGLTWTKYAQNPVITHGPGAYDARYTRAPSVIFDNGTYKMWYTATPELANISALGYFYSVAYATSPDGVNWTKYPGNPVFRGFNESGYTTAGWTSVVMVNGTYLMAFSDGWLDLGYATSGDGITWAFSNSTTILLGPQSWHNAIVLDPSLLVQGSRLLLWYDGIQSLSNASAPFASGIGFATCGLAVVPPPVVTVSSTTSTTTVTKSTVSTSISTSIVSSTFTVNPSAPLYEVAISGVVGFASAMAVAVALIAFRLRARRPS